MPQVVYRLVGDTSDLEAKLASVDNALRKVGTGATSAEKQVVSATDRGTKGSKEMAAGFDKLEDKLTEVVGVFKDFSVAANKAAKPIKAIPTQTKPASTSIKKLETGFVSLKEGAEGFGGEMGAVVGRIDKFAKSAAAAGSAMGPWGMGIAAVTLGLGGLAWAVTAVTSAAIEFVSGADEMIDRLDEIAGIEAIPDRTIEQLDRFESMMLAAEVRAGFLKTVIAGDLGEALSDMGWALVGVLDVLAKFYVAAGEGADQVERLSDEVAHSPLALFAAMAAEKFGDFADSAREAHKELADLADVEFEEFGPDFELFEKNEDRKTKAAEDAAKERAKINKTVEDQLRKDAEESAKETDAELKERLAKWKADQEERVRINKEASAQLVIDVAEATAKIDAFYEALGDAIKEAMFSALSATADLVDHFTAKAMEKDQERKDKQLEILAETRGGFRNHLDRIESLENQLAHERDEERRTQLQREIDAQRKEVDAHKDANKDKRETAKQRAREAHREMVKAFRANKAAQISGVLIDSAAAYMGFLEYFGDKIGPFAPAAAAALVAPATGASIAKIAAEQPPKFHDGVGAVDEMLATLRSGEAVLNQRGAQAAGGSQAIEAMNRGTPPGPTTLVFSYAGRAVERVVLDAMQRGGPLQSAMAGGPAGVSNPYRGK